MVTVSLLHNVPCLLIFQSLSAIEVLWIRINSAVSAGLPAIAPRPGVTLLQRISFPLLRSLYLIQSFKVYQSSTRDHYCELTHFPSRPALQIAIAATRTNLRKDSVLVCR